MRSCIMLRIVPGTVNKIQQANVPPRQDTSPSWQQCLADGFRTPEALLNFLSIDANDPTIASRIINNNPFPVRVTRRYAARMVPGDLNDPLLRQVLPLHEEALDISGFTTDPLDEAKQNPVPGLLHKYHGRVLLTLTGTCAINCRFCFRRHFDYSSNNPGRAGWQTAMDYIAKDTSIQEVILSGGEPLMASDKTFSELFTTLSALPHIKRIRFHTRLPLLLPERFTENLYNLMRAVLISKQIILVLHTNHANEIDDSVAEVITRLKQLGVETLNQSVLLAGINDTIEPLVQLSEALYTMGVLPYYLHQLDKVAGTAHFEVSEKKGRALIASMQAVLPGYMVPKYVREEAFAQSKTEILT